MPEQQIVCYGKNKIWFHSKSFYSVDKLFLLGKSLELSLTLYILKSEVFLRFICLNTIYYIY